MWIADNWKDYEVIDTSSGEKLERWGKYILLRPDPQVIWDTRKTHPLYRRILSGGGTILSNLVLGTKLADMTSGYEAFQRHVLEQFDFDKFLSTGHMYQTEMKYYCRNFSYKEVPIHYIAGKSSLKWKAVKEALIILFKLKDNEKKVFKNVASR